MLTIYTPGQNVWSGSKNVVTFGLIKILTNMVVRLSDLGSKMS